jgi:hypothetical protein
VTGANDLERVQTFVDGAVPFRAWCDLRLDGRRRVAVQLLADELDDDPLDKLCDGAAQLVSDERLDRLG